MVTRPKHVAVTEYNIQTSVALNGNPESDLVDSSLTMPRMINPNITYLHSVLFLAHVPYFEEIKLGLSDHHAVCLYIPLINF
jgi:hypothetical protein